MRAQASALAIFAFHSAGVVQAQQALHLLPSTLHYCLIEFTVCACLRPLALLEMLLPIYHDRKPLCPDPHIDCPTKHARLLHNLKVGIL